MHIILLLEIQRKLIQEELEFGNNEVFLEACNSLKVKPDLVLSDGYMVKGIQIPNKAVIKGDTKSACIANCINCCKSI